MNFKNLLTLGLSVVALGCQPASQTTGPTTAPSSTESNRTAQAGPATPTANAGPALGFVNAKPVTWAELRPTLVEAAGGQALAEYTLDLLIGQRMTQRQLSLSNDIIAAEREAMLQSFSSNPDEATRVLREVREVRGLGEERFSRLLARNASLRLLVRDEVQVTDAALREGYELQFGPRYEMRLIVTETLADAGDIAARARKGESFSDIAARRSKDPSSAQGGLLSPISPADTDYPQVIRNVMVKLQANEVSDPIALENGFAVVRLEKKIEASKAKFDDVKKGLEVAVRKQIEGVMMKRLARTLLVQADVVVLDPALQKVWQIQKRRMAEER